MELDAKARSPASRPLIVNRGTRRMGTSHDQLEQLLRDFNAAYNARHQRVLDGKTPNQIVKERMKARRKLARPKPETPEGHAGPEDIARARLVAEVAKEVSQPDT